MKWHMCLAPLTKPETKLMEKQPDKCPRQNLKVLPENNLESENLQNLFLTDSRTFYRCFSGNYYWSFEESSEFKPYSKKIVVRKNILIQKFLLSSSRNKTHAKSFW